MNQQAEVKKANRRTNRFKWALISYPVYILIFFILGFQSVAFLAAFVAAWITYSRLGAPSKKRARFLNQSGFLMDMRQTGQLGSAAKTLGGIAKAGAFIPGVSVYSNAFLEGVESVQQQSEAVTKFGYDLCRICFNLGYENVSDEIQDDLQTEPNYVHVCFAQWQASRMDGYFSGLISQQDSTPLWRCSHVHTSKDQADECAWEHWYLHSQGGCFCFKVERPIPDQILRETQANKNNSYVYLMINNKLSAGKVGMSSNRWPIRIQEHAQDGWAMVLAVKELKPLEAFLLESELLKISKEKFCVGVLKSEMKQGGFGETFFLNERNGTLFREVQEHMRQRAAILNGSVETEWVPIDPGIGPKLGS